MSYSNGIGSLQQALTSVATSGPKPLSASDAAVRTDNQALDAAGERGDKTNLSVASGIMAQALGGSDTRSARVSELQQAIAAGTYNVSSSDVAGKMIHSLLGE